MLYAAFVHIFEKQLNGKKTVFEIIFKGHLKKTTCIDKFGCVIQYFTASCSSSVCRLYRHLTLLTLLTKELQAAVKVILQRYYAIYRSFQVIFFFLYIDLWTLSCFTIHVKLAVRLIQFIEQMVLKQCAWQNKSCYLQMVNTVC